MKHKKNKGFTLYECIIALVVIVIVSTSACTAVSLSITTSNRSLTYTTVRELDNAMREAFLYATTLDEFVAIVESKYLPQFENYSYEYSKYISKTTTTGNLAEGQRLEFQFAYEVRYVVFVYFSGSTGTSTARPYFESQCYGRKSLSIFQHTLEKGLPSAYA